MPGGGGGWVEVVSGEDGRSESEEAPVSGWSLLFLLFLLFSLFPGIGSIGSLESRVLKSWSVLLFSRLRFREAIGVIVSSSSDEEESMSILLGCCLVSVPRTRSKNSRSARLSSWTAVITPRLLLVGSASSSSSRSSTTSRYCDTEEERRDLEGNCGDDCSASSNEVSISSCNRGLSLKREMLVPGVDAGCCWVEEGRANLVERDDADADAGDG